MIQYQPAYSRFGRLGQQQAPATAPPAAAAPSTTIITPPAATGYTGVPGFLETVAILGASAAAVYTGVRAGMNKSNNKTNRIAGWIGGVGAGLIGLLYLGGKSGLSQQAKLPSVAVIS